jgi:hypothetical protein
VQKIFLAVDDLTAQVSPFIGVRTLYHQFLSIIVYPNLCVGKIITVCDFPEAECFRAEVTTGRTNFHGDGGDLANIYVPANDYDTWKQYTTSGTSADFETPSASVSSSVSLPVEGEFIYQLRNDTLSCLTVELRWMFGSAPQQQIPSSAAAVVHPRGEAKEPEFMCVGTPIAMNWDCHLDWALTTECWYNSSSSLVTAVYTVTNLGPEEVDGEGRVIVVNKKDDQPPAVTVVRKSR